MAWKIVKALGPFCPLTVMSFDPGRRNEVTSKHVDVLWACSAKASLLVLPTLYLLVEQRVSLAAESGTSDLRIQPAEG